MIFKLIFICCMMFGVLFADIAQASVDPYQFRKTKAYCLFQTGDYERAIHAYEEMALRNIADDTVFYNLGCLYVKIERYDLAIRAFENVISSLSPLGNDSIYNLSVIYGRYLNDEKKAIYYYTKYLNEEKAMELTYVDN